MVGPHGAVSQWEGQTKRSSHRATSVLPNVPATGHAGLFKVKLKGINVKIEVLSGYISSVQ